MGGQKAQPLQPPGWYYDADVPGGNGAASSVRARDAFDCVCDTDRDRRCDCADVRLDCFYFTESYGDGRSPLGHCRRAISDADAIEHYCAILDAAADLSGAPGDRRAKAEREGLR